MNTHKTGILHNRGGGQAPNIGSVYSLPEELSQCPGVKYYTWDMGTAREMPVCSLNRNSGLTTR